MENRGRRRGLYKKILVAYDGSPGARRALKAAIELADQSDAELHCISVEEKLPYYAATLGEVEEAKVERDAYFDTLIREARQMAWDCGIELHSKSTTWSCWTGSCPARRGSRSAGISEGEGWPRPS